MKCFFLEDFGGRPNSGLDTAPALRRAVAAAAKAGGGEIVMSGGTYDIFHTEATPLDIHISNTHSEEESPDITRHFALLFKDICGVTLNGCGAVIRLHGKMTIAGIVNSESIKIKNLSFEVPHPMLTEMTVTAEGDGFLDCAVQPDSLYRIKDGKIEWYGENFAFSKGISQLYDPDSGLTWRAFSPMQDENALWEELSPGLLRLRYKKEDGKPNPYSARVGYVFQMRDPLRDETGILISDSRNVTVENVSVDFMNCMGFMVQNSENVTADGFNAVPTRGRTAANSSDAMHISGCRGKLTIKNCSFIGAHDDAINIHGTHLNVIRREGSRVVLRFMHPQTFGIGGFKSGDRIAAVDPESLLYVGQAEVVSAEELSPRELLLEIKGDISAFSENTPVENLSAVPDAEITDNYFERVPTRGILVTSGGKIKIKNNVFNHIKGCGVLIADDARSWYESGPVRDVEISGNVYKNSGGPFVCVAPENSRYDGPVHKNVRVTDNDIFFRSNDDELYARVHPWEHKKNDLIASAKATEGFVLKENRIFGGEEKCFVHLTDCTEAAVKDNTFDGEIEVCTD